MKTLSLSDLIVPSSLSIEDYGNERAEKIFLAGKSHGRPRKWSALYCDLQPKVREQINTVDGTVSSVALVHQIDGPHKGKFLAIASPRCHIGKHYLAVVDSLGDCELPGPFETLEDLRRLP